MYTIKGDFPASDGNAEVRLWFRFF